MIPFNRNALWRKHASNVQPLSLFRAYTEHSAIAADLPSSSPAADCLSPESAAEDSSPASDPFPPHISASVAEAIEFVKRKDKLSTTGGPPSYDEVMAAYLRLQESSSVVVEFAETGAEKQPKAPEKQRISPRK